VCVCVCVCVRSELCLWRGEGRKEEGRGALVEEGKLLAEEADGSSEFVGEKDDELGNESDGHFLMFRETKKRSYCTD